MDMDEVVKILEEAQENSLIEVSALDRITAELNKAWNRGVKMMFSEALSLFYRHEREKEGQA